MHPWGLLGLAGLAGVAATGVLLVRGERQRRAHTPEEVTTAELVSGRGHRLARVLHRR